jgi:hypothetical protein
LSRGTSLGPTYWRTEQRSDVIATRQWGTIDVADWAS